MPSHRGHPGQRHGALLKDRRGGDDHGERVSQADALAEHVERRTAAEARADDQLAILALELRMLEIGKIAGRLLAALHVLAAVLGENLLREHALQRAELEMNLDRAQIERGHQ
ncbi:MAG: hypothetical protein ABSH42_12330 [Bryobacteraceae bacterium]